MQATPTAAPAALIPERLARIRARLTEKLTPNGECSVFTGTKSSQGYGSLSVGGNTVKAHRLAWELENGPIEAGLCVCHRCDNPSCCRIGHLFLGTVAQNNADRAAKGRSKGVFPAGPTHPAVQSRGESHWCARLSADAVRAIRTARSAGETVTSLAARFNVHHATISRIARGVWRTEVSL